jgi:hypothetical protein
LVKKNIIKHGGGWVLVLILVAHAILSTLGSPQIWKGPWQIVMSYCHFIEGHTWCPIWIPIDVKMVCHVILSFHWNPQMTSQMRSHLETVPFDLKPFVMSYCHFIGTHKWHPKWHPLWRLYLPIQNHLSCHWNPQMISQMRSHLETVPMDLKPFVMSYCHFIETHKWHPKWDPIWRLYLPI